VSKEGLLWAGAWWSSQMDEGGEAGGGRAGA
jgi:hypothetical protein